MDDEQPKTTLYLPHELVWEIMVRLPVKSLLRFRCACKAWRDTISNDAEFRGANLRFQTPRLLVSKHDHENKVTTVGLYVSEESEALAEAMDLPQEDEAQSFSHCDGLVLMPTETVVRVLYLATRRVLTLPESSNSVAPSVRFHEFLTHQVFGIGHDPRNNTYRVVHFFFGPMDPILTGGYHHNYGMEVFTIGIDQHWRETTAQPPYPADISGNTAFFKGSLFWIIDESKLPNEESAPGFLRFRLEDESFSVTQAPPHCQGIIYETSYLAELRGELSVAHTGPKYDSVEIWMCNDVDNNPPRWNRRYIFKTFCLLEDELLQPHLYYRCQYSLLKQVLKDIVGGNGDLKHHHLDSTIPYIPSLVPL